MKSRVGLSALIAFFLVISTINGYSAVKTGDSCKKLGTTAVAAGKKFTCVKSGKKLVWNKGVAVAVPVAKPAPTPVATATPSPVATPTPTTTPTPTPTVAPVVDPLADCKLPVMDGRGDVSIGGWPRIATRGKTMGDVNVAIIMVDFPDAVATMTPQDAFAKVSGAKAVFDEVSYGKLRYNFNPTFKWYRMSQPSTAYAPLNKSFYTHREYIVEAMNLADKDVDFSKTDSFLILANPDARGIGNSGPAFSANYPYGIALDGNLLYNGATSSYDLNYWKSIWLNHEITHSMGLVDLYAYKASEVRVPNDGFRFTGDFGYMGLSSYESTAPSLFAYERWNLGWIDDAQIVCSNAAKQQHVITPVQSAGGLKAVVIPISLTKAVVIESRRAIGLDNKLKKVGALVYLVDSSIQSGLGPVQIFPRDLINDPKYLAAPRAVGESVVVEGYTIKVVASDVNGDTVEITKG